jgi:asparagine synthase (glutamine-hydrolysing)
VFSRNLPRYFAGRQRVGISLTGGLDSRIIMAWQKSPPGALPSYTWGGMYRDCHDVLVAREVARTSAQPHDVIVLGNDFLSRFADYADRAVFLSDGLVDVRGAADVYMNARAREIAPVRMTGLFGGEVLRRVRMFKPALPMPGLFGQELLPEFERARRTYEDVLQGHPLSFGVFRQAAWHHYSSLSLEQTQITMRTPFLDNEFVKTVFQASPSAGTSYDVSLRLISDGNAALSRIPTDRGLGGRGQLSQAVAHAVKEFTFKAEYAYDYGMPQWLARIDHRLARLHIERLFLGRHKPLHFRMWYREQLARYVRDILLDPRTLSRPYVNRIMVERLVHEHTKGTRNYTTEIHKLLKLELLHRIFIDGSVGTGIRTSAAACRDGNTPRATAASANGVTEPSRIRVA